MAWMNQEKKAKIAANLKSILKDTNIKYSLIVLHHSKILLTIREGDVDWFADLTSENTFDRKYIQVNNYWIDKNFKGKSKDLLLQIEKAMRSADYYDRSDAMTDYFDTAYYYSINIGEWNKPYKLTTQ